MTVAAAGLVWAVASPLSAHQAPGLVAPGPPAVVGDPATSSQPADAPLSSDSVSNPCRSGWYPYVIARPADRQWIESLPISKRPSRPLHFYGNAVRRGRLPHGPVGQRIFGE